jgi:glycosyltransferase involved in cell wall biosynthesis
MTAPLLSICVPSRNRQRYFQETIGFLLESTRDDVEFVLADNSDDATVMNGFMADIVDPRVKYLASTDRTLSMKENWARCLEAATGDWITVIGDDDLIDPEVVHALQAAIALKSGLEAFGWSHMQYAWATEASPPRNVRLRMAATFHDMPRSLIFRRAYRWDDAGMTLNSGFSVYHSAISRRLLEKVRARFGGVYFEHPTLDYDNALKNAALGQNFVYCMRPFSILGACPESHSVLAFEPKRFAEVVARLKAEIGSDFESEPWMRGFPFPSVLGMTATIAQVHQFMHHTYGIGMEGWEPNFAAACAAYCSKFKERDDFEAVSSGLREAFAIFKGGAFLKDFRPTFTPHREAGIYTGMLEGDLLVDDRIGGARTPTEFYKVVNALLTRPSDLIPELRTATRDATVIARLAA